MIQPESRLNVADNSDLSAEAETSATSSSRQYRALFPEAPSRRVKW